MDFFSPDCRPQVNELGDSGSVIVNTNSCDSPYYTHFRLGLKTGGPSGPLRDGVFHVGERKKVNSSMQLTRAADYGVRVMVALAAMPEGRRVSLQALSRGTDSPESFLSKVLQTLTRAGLINSWRGQGGGFQISPEGRGASIREVVEAIDGPIVLNVCLAEGHACRRSSWCPSHPVWVRAQSAMLAVLESGRIQDLAEQGAVNEFVLVANGCIRPATGSSEAH